MSIKVAADRRHHVLTHLIAGSAHGWSQRNDQLRSLRSSLDQPIDGCWKDSSCDATPSGMAGRGMARAWIGDQHWCAVGSAHPEALASLITDQAIRFRPGLSLGRARFENDAAVNLLRAVNRGTGTDAPYQLVWSPSMPEPGKEAVLKSLREEQITLQVITPIAADPSPAWKRVEAAVRPIEGVSSHAFCCASGHRDVAQHPEACKGLFLRTGLNGDELQPACLISGGMQSVGDLL